MFVQNIFSQFLYAFFILLKQVLTFNHDGGQWRCGRLGNDNYHPVKLLCRSRKRYKATFMASVISDK